MAPQVGLEPTTLRLTGEIHPLHPTTPANQNQQNNRKRCRGFAPFWLPLAAVHGQKTDSIARKSERSQKEVCEVIKTFSDPKLLVSSLLYADGRVQRPQPCITSHAQVSLPTHTER